MTSYTTHRCPNCKKLVMICFDGIIYYGDKFEFVCYCGEVVRFDGEDRFIRIEECPEGSAKARKIK